MLGCKEHIVDVRYFKSRYSTEAINYFCEVALHSEAEDNRAVSIMKWNRDIFIYIEDDTPGPYKKSVLSTVSRLNRLQLPMRLSITSDKQKANVHVYFGTHEAFRARNFVKGYGEINRNRSGWIDHAVVKVLIEPNRPAIEDNRESTVMEEITQCLGTVGDSYLYPLSVFYERPNTVTQLADIDKQILQLLYDPAMPVGYSNEQFEKDFADVLYHVNSEEKLLRYLREQAVGKQTLKSIIQDGLITSDGYDQARVIKYNQPIAVTAQGDTTARHIRLLQQAIQQLNGASKQLQLYLAKDSLPYDGGIHYHFKQVDKLENPASSIATKVATQSTKQLLFHRRFTTDVHVDYKDTTALQQKMPLAIANTLYQTISLLHQPAPLFFTYQNDSLQLEPEYREVLRTYYVPELANNMTKVQLESVLAQMP